MKTYHTYSSTNSKILIYCILFQFCLDFKCWVFAVFLITSVFCSFPFPLSSMRYLFVIFITSHSLKHIHRTLLPLPFPQTYSFGMESSPCLFTISITKHTI